MVIADTSIRINVQRRPGSGESTPPGGAGVQATAGSADSSIGPWAIAGGREQLSPRPGGLPQNGVDSRTGQESPP